MGTYPESDKERLLITSDAPYRAERWDKREIRGGTEDTDAGRPIEQSADDCMMKYERL